MKTLSQSGLLGRYPLRAGYVQLEHQIGKRLIWVMCRPDDSEPECVERADEMLGMAFSGIAAAIALAEKVSRALFPEFWVMHDRSGIAGHRLDVWSVTLTPDEGTVSYDVSRNHEFDFKAPAFDPADTLREHPFALPDVPEELFIVVDRSPSGVMQVRPT